MHVLWKQVACMYEQLRMNHNALQALLDPRSMQLDFIIRPVLPACIHNPLLVHITTYHAMGCRILGRLSLALCCTTTWASASRLALCHSNLCSGRTPQIEEL